MLLPQCKYAKLTKISPWTNQSFQQCFCQGLNIQGFIQQQQTQQKRYNLQTNRNNGIAHKGKPTLLKIILNRIQRISVKSKQKREQKRDQSEEVRKESERRQKKRWKVSQSCHSKQKKKGAQIQKQNYLQGWPNKIRSHKVDRSGSRLPKIEISWF